MSTNDDRPVPRRRIKKKRKTPQRARHGTARGQPERERKKKKKTEVLELPTFERFYPLDLLDVSPASRPDMIQRVIDSDAVDVRCPYHPPISATGMCSRCKRPLCPQCSLRRQFFGKGVRTPDICGNCRSSRLIKISIFSLVVPTLALFLLFSNIVSIPRSIIPIIAAILVVWFTIFFWLLFSLRTKRTIGFNKLAPRQLAEWYIYKGKLKTARRVLESAGDEVGAEILRSKVAASMGYGTKARRKK